MVAIRKVIKMKHNSEIVTKILKLGKYSRKQKVQFCKMLLRSHHIRDCKSTTILDFVQFIRKVLKKAAVNKDTLC